MKFRFSGNLLRYVDFHREVEVQGDTVAEGVNNISQKFPGFARIIHDLNGELLNPGNYDQPVTSDDVIGVITPIAGG